MSASSAKEHEDVISDDDDEQTIKEERMLAEKVELFVNSHERDTSKAEIDPDRAWRTLKRGNDLFAQGDIGTFAVELGRQVTRHLREVLCTGQHPIATVLSCSDSRVSPEILFDAGLGQLFVVRNAGNVIGEDVIASIEYGVVHLKTPLLLIMGHQNCGAVTACVNYTREHHENLLDKDSLDMDDEDSKFLSHDSPMSGLMEKIMPAVITGYRELASSHGDEFGDDQLVELAVEHNVLNMVEKLSSMSEPLRSAILSKAVKVVGLKYSLQEGQMEELVKT